MINDLLGLIFIVSVLAGMALFLRSKYSKATAKEPSLERAELDRRNIELMPPIEVKHVMVIGDK